MQFRVRRRGGGDRYRCCLAFILLSFLHFLGSSGSLGETAVTRFIFFIGLVGGWKSKLRTTRVLFYIGFIFSREFQLSEVREVDHGGKMGHPRWDVGGE